MSVTEFLAQLHQTGIRLRADGDRLRYDAPPGAVTASLREELLQRKAAILDFLKENPSIGGSGMEPIPTVSRDAPLPLSFAQQRLWFLHRMAPESAHYNVPSTTRLQGPLDVDALRSSLNQLVERHETLRTAFTGEDQPHQVISSPREFDLPMVDLSILPDSQRQSEAQRLAEEEVQRPFDLANPPLIRGLLLRCDTESHILVLTMHHIVSDGWSMGVLLRDLIEFYRARLDRREPDLPVLPVQYVDFAVWQRAWMDAGELDRQTSYWRDRLNDLPVLQLPTDRPRPIVPSRLGRRIRRTLPQNLVESIKNLSFQENATPFITMLAAFQVLLQRYTGQDDLLVGCPIANRCHPQTAGLLGFFVNSLVLRADATGNPPFRRFLAQVRSTALEAFDHQDLPFEKLVESLNPARDPSRNPLFQVIFALQNAPVPPLTTGDLRLSLGWSETAASRVDLEIHVIESSDGAAVVAVYDTELFVQSTVETLLDRYCRLLEAIVSDPDQRLSSFSLIDEVERRRVLIEWNDTTTPYPRDATIRELFEEHAAAQPDAPALICGQQRLTYGELNARANQLARHIQELGAGPETVVGLCLDRGFDLIVALLGILKAGAAYLPLDPGYPTQRLDFMLRDAAAPLLLTHSRLLDRLPTPLPAQVVCLDAAQREIDRQKPAALATPVSAGSLAYIIYTSGSTGLPKGAAIPHRAVVRLVRNTNFVSLGPDDVLLQFAPVSFDASTFEIWGSLLNGARLSIFPPHTPALEELGDFIGEQKITTLWLTAALFHQMADRQPESLNTVRQLLAGGDVLSVSHVKKMLRRLRPGQTLVNGYGPTENTTFTCCHVMDASSETGCAVPIGRPISNTRVYILDSALQPVPPGLPGELYIGGDGLARGYLNRDDLNRERFLTNPFSSEPGDRIYKTGDRCRWRADGTIDFLGRRDHQVKIRGFRVELGEIEACLRKNPAVRDAVVSTLLEDSGDKRLIAYVVLHPGAEATPHSMREFLSAQLPPYLIPSACLFLAALPLTPNGKVDRGALPVPSRDDLDPLADFIGPRTPVEEIVAGVFTEHLKLERVGVHDNFFELGGHSLLATRIVSHLRAALGLDIPLIAIFHHPTVAGLACRITGQLMELDRQESVQPNERV
ncbi:MAG TPA: amino acid adenylation domain-containing protein [Verrucomicrobiales bacterium]|nr:amino acid adenylation domain-containing protein [Verrucomicrobiales bacterium]